ncbi:MAG: TetR/AcrR family transcriptional regulator, partial [Planctomycetes bacterium]|nr:TetR/AcrR family transcriptional regulator [Planctomycetota bacterium]
MARKSNRDAILDAAEKVVNKHGLANATMDAVASEAGVSKGGLFYHFPSKREMFSQLIDRHVERYTNTRDRLLAEMPDEPASFIKASLLANLDTSKPHQNLANIISLLEDMDLRSKVLEIKQHMYEELVRRYDRPELVALVLLATDGLWVAELFGANVFTDEIKQGVVTELV